MQRYLAEIVWFPSVALSPNISWKQLCENAAEATMEFKGTKGTGVFYFNESGDFVKFVAMRYKDTNKDSELVQWTVVSKKNENKNGIIIPVELDAKWKIENKDWTWLKLKIKEIKYNIQ
jgi:hypothetical protein